MSRDLYIVTEVRRVATHVTPTRESLSREGRQDPQSKKRHEGACVQAASAVQQGAVVVLMSHARPAFPRATRVWESGGDSTHTRPVARQRPKAGPLPHALPHRARADGPPGPAATCHFELSASCPDLN